jgi:DNA-directed RNA polymerase specialized sigma24 family protein
VTITTRKAIDQAQHQRRQKRGGGRVAGAADREDEPFDRIAAREPTPEFAALVAEECRRRLDGLRDETLRRIALGKMEGYTHEEIAERLGLGLRSVVHELALIRKAWSGEGSP